MNDVAMTAQVDLNRRCRLPELMDDAQLDRDDHRHALLGLRTINWFSCSATSIWRELQSLTPRAGHKTLRVLDLACGGGDIAVDVARRALKSGRNITVDGCDISSFAVEHSSRLAAARNVPNVRFFPLNALSDDLPRDYDVLMCSLFLHHLGDEDAIRLLRRMKAATNQMVIVNDLRRTRFGYGLAWLACRALTRSHVVHIDGPLSVRAAFGCAEIRRLAIEAGMPDADIALRWPQRFLLSWRKSR